MILSFCFLAAGQGCHARSYAVAPPPVVVKTAPPEVVIADEHDPCPDDQAWIDDHAHWNGQAWVIVKGECASRPGYEWVPPVYADVQGGVSYTPGFWKPVSVTKPK